MAVVYKCRHCGNEIGKLDQQVVDAQMLGWNKLSTEDKKEMFEYYDNGDIHIKTICENCQDSLEQHPNYHELDFFIQ